jgi:hypothetical protein
MPGLNGFRRKSRGQAGSPAQPPRKFLLRERKHESSMAEKGKKQGWTSWGKGLIKSVSKCATSAARIALQRLVLLADSHTTQTYQLPSRSGCVQRECDAGVRPGQHSRLDLYKAHATPNQANSAPASGSSANSQPKCPQWRPQLGHTPGLEGARDLIVPSAVILRRMRTLARTAQSDRPGSVIPISEGPDRWV